MNGEGQSSQKHGRVAFMFGEMLDTSPAQRDAYYARLKGLSVQERAAMLTRLCRGVRKLAEGIRHQHPDFTAAEVRRELAVRLYGEDVAQRLLGSKASSSR
jgi:hypothetical protein